MITDTDYMHYVENGWVVVSALFTEKEVACYRDHYMGLRAQGSYSGDYAAATPLDDDPLKRFPRMIHMHRWDKQSLRWLLEPRLNAVMTRLLGREPLAVQTMLYFKPPGARGQALHQDQSYLRVRPGTCMAAWLALDTCDEENGCLQVVSGSHRLPLLCTEPADTTRSFTDVTVPVPPEWESTSVYMQPGDVLFFHGALIHGSLPNCSAERFRRALIGHYIAGEAESVAPFYHPVLRMDGTEVALQESDFGGPCGVWKDRNGRLEVELITRPAGTAQAVSE